MLAIDQNGHTIRVASPEDDQLQRLAHLKEQINTGLETFLEVGRALQEIRDRRLYKLEGYNSFDEFCAQWRDRGLTRQRASHLINASQVIDDLSTIVDADELPTNEAQCRALRLVPESDRVAVLRAANAEAQTGGQQLTARLIKETHQAMAEEPKRELPSREEIEQLYSQVGSVHWNDNSNAFIVEAPGKTMSFRGITHAWEQWRWHGEKWLRRWGKNSHPRRVMTSANSHEHYTPKEVIDAVLECFGGEIDLDPCSNEPTDGNPNIPASWHFTKEDDGLAQNWVAANAFLNPPYSTFVLDENGDLIPCRDEKGAIAHNSDGSVKYKTRGCMGDWLNKLIEEYEAGHLQQAILLCKVDTSTDWFQKIWQSATAVCFINHRLKFHGTVEDGSAATFASACVYFGAEINCFYYAFQHLGPITQVITPELFGE